MTVKPIEAGQPRTAALQALLDHAAAAMAAAGPGPAAPMVEEVFRRLCHAGRPGASPSRLPVCDLLPAAVAASHPDRAAVAGAFAALALDLPWARPQRARPEDAALWNGSANAVIAGPGGLEERDDVWIGATLMAPGVVYPDHDHPPEEVYLSLTPGEWWNAAMDWTDPGGDGLIHNPPGILHAMRARPGTPFLALWFLPL